ncbi:unnamed protein product, partial [Tilletia caries]
MVLIKSTSTFMAKAEDRWKGPYAIIRQTHSGSYELQELDGTPLERNYGSDRLREYFPRPRVINEERFFLDDAVDGTFNTTLGP